jgi:hypothetical protein
VSVGGPHLSTQIEGLPGTRIADLPSEGLTRRQAQV